MTPWLGPYWVKKGRHNADARPTYMICTKSGYVVIANLSGKRIAEQMCETMNRTGGPPEPKDAVPDV